MADTRNILHPFVKPLITISVGLKEKIGEKQKVSLSAIRKVKSIKWKGELRWAKYLNRDIWVDIWSYQQQLLCSGQASHTPLSAYLTFWSLSSVKRLPLTRPQWRAPPWPSLDQSFPTWWRTPATCCRWPAHSWTPRNCSAEKCWTDWSKNLKIGWKLSGRKLFQLNPDITNYKHICLRWQRNCTDLRS